MALALMWLSVDDKKLVSTEANKILCTNVYQNIACKKVGGRGMDSGNNFK